MQKERERKDREMQWLSVSKEQENEINGLKRMKEKGRIWM